MKPMSALSILLLTCTATPALAGSCKEIHADLVEVRSTEGCNPGLSFCFLGEVDGNHGLRGVTHFRADGVGEPAPTSPDSSPYSGPFEYRTARGDLLMRETGVVVPGAVVAHQRITEGTGEFAGVSGQFYVAGTRGGGIITAKVTGEICYPE